MNHVVNDDGSGAGDGRPEDGATAPASGEAASAPPTGDGAAASGPTDGDAGPDPEASEAAAASFEDLGLPARLLDAVRRQGYTDPTPIQRRAIPPALEGRDVLGCAQTGTGKTAAFTLPMLARFAEDVHGVLRGLIITPTRELARQVEEAVAAYGATSSVEPMLVHGGVPIGPEIRDLEFGCDVLVATPGRLLDHLRRGTVDLSSVEVLVLDEADRMLDMGFIDDVRAIVDATPASRQTFLFSATMPNAILSLAHDLMRDPVRVQVGFETSAEGIREVVHPVDWSEKHTLLLHLLEEETEGQVLVFTRTRATTDYVASFLRSRDVSVDDLHGGKSQAERTESLRRFRAGDTRVLIATNVAARGLDIRGIRHVVNFDVPEDPRDYVHRVGRTARADETGDAITLMARKDWLLVRDIESLTGQAIERRSVEGFEPSVEPPAPRTEEPEEEEKPRRRSPLLGRRGRR